MYTIYILYSRTHDKYYVGFTENVEARFRRHNEKMVPETKFFTPWELKRTESFETRELAEHREKEIKNKRSKKYIEALVDMT